MKLCLSLVTCLLLAAGCKTDKPEQTAAAAQDNAASAETPRHKGRSGKIEFTRPPRRDQPALPAEGSDGDSGSDDREARWEQRRERMAERRKERMAALDTDGDGTLSPDELAAAKTKRVEEMHGRFDADGDGKLTPAELGDARMFRRGMGDPSELDADKNGDISNAELEAGMDKMRQQFRRNWEDRAGRNGVGPGSAQPK
jgi:hypothetical protein